MFREQRVFSVRAVCRVGCIAGFIALALTLAAPADSANAFSVSTCDDASPQLNNSWGVARTMPDGQLEASSVCPAGAPDPYGDLSNGLAVVDVRKVLGAVPDGAYTEWRFAAPSGTRIRGLAVTRDIGNRDEWTPYGRIDAVDQAGESCMRGMNQAFCRIEGRRVFSGLDATSVAYGIRCVVAPYCAHGATLRTVWALVLGATVTLEDLEPPVVGAPAASGVADGKWQSGDGVLTFSASDNTGVRRRRVLVDGVERAVWTAPGAVAGGCGELDSGVAYTYAQPCAGARGLNGSLSHAVAPCAWGDGVHSVKVAAMDTGGTERVSVGSAAVRVDCTAPVVSLAVAESAGMAEPEVAVSDAHAGVASTEVQLSVDFGPFVSSHGPLAMERGRAYRFRARATDRAGNVSDWVASEVLSAPVPAALPEPVSEAERRIDPLLAPLEPLVGDGEDERREVAATTTRPTAPTARITRRTLRRGTLRLRGTVTLSQDARVVVTIRLRTRTIRRTVRATHGVWRLTLRLSRRGKPRVLSTRATALAP